MGRSLNITIVAILAFAVAGCSSSGEQSSNPTPGVTPIANQKVPSQSFSNPVVPAKGTGATATTNPNLIQPTNATEHLVAITKGRNDPFAQFLPPSLFGTPTSVANNTPNNTLNSASNNSSNNTSNTRIATTLVSTSNKISSPAKAIPAINKTPANLPKSKIGSNGAIASAKVPKISLPTLLPVVPKVLPQIVPNQTLTAILPPTPQPELARTIMITGVALVGDQPQAIIKVPNEPTSRYVEAGQQLENGVFVKRIEMNEGSDPVVILEQYGMEVARMVGETSSPSTAQKGVTPVSATQPLPPPPNAVPAGTS